MGRCLTDSIVFPQGGGLVVVGRQVPIGVSVGRVRFPNFVWIAYSLSVPLHLQGVGPCSSHEEVMQLVPIEFRD